MTLPVGVRLKIFQYSRCGFISALAAGLQEEHAVALEHEAGEPVPGKGTGIDADPIRPYLRGRRDGVSVDDDLAMVSAALQEFVPNPKHVVLGLIFKPDARPNPGMNEEVVAFNVSDRR